MKVTLYKHLFKPLYDRVRGDAAVPGGGVSSCSYLVV